MNPDEDPVLDDFDHVDLAQINGPDEFEEVQTELRTLLKKVKNPVLRVCLEDVLEEVAFLSSQDGGVEALEDQEAA